jgi:hypothetical protein
MMRLRHRHSTREAFALTWSAKPYQVEDEWRWV